MAHAKRSLYWCFLCLPWAVSQLGAQNKDTPRNPKTVALVFFEDLYQGFQTMESVITLRTAVSRDRLESLNFENVWPRMDPSELNYPYTAYSVRKPYVTYTVGYRFSPVRGLTFRAGLDFTPNTSENLYDNSLDVASSRNLSFGTGVNVGDLLSISLDVLFQDSDRTYKLSNASGFASDGGNLNTAQTRALNSYHRSFKSATFSIRPQKNLFFEPRFSFSLSREEFTRTLEKSLGFDPALAMGNTSETTDGLNSEPQKNIISLQAGFTLRPWSDVVLTGNYSLSPLNAAPLQTPQVFNTHVWSLSLDLRLNKHLRLVTSYTLTRNQFLFNAPYQSFFYDSRYEVKDSVNGFESREAARSSFDERNMDRDRFAVTAEIR